MFEHEDAILKRIGRFQGHLDKDENILEMSDSQVEALRREHEAFAKCTEAFVTLADTMNRYSTDGLVRHAFIEAMTRTHRHLQGTLIVELLTGLGDYGKMYKEHDIRWADGRNEFAMKLLQTFRERFKDELFWKDGA